MEILGHDMGDDGATHVTWKASDTLSYSIALYRGKVVLAREYIDSAAAANSPNMLTDELFDYAASGSRDRIYDGSWTIWHRHHARIETTLGFGYDYEDPKANAYGANVLIIPLWAPLAALLAIVGRDVARTVRCRRRRRRGLCVACGYDLRASIDRCPECGELP